MNGTEFFIKYRTADNKWHDGHYIYDKDPLSHVQSLADEMVSRENDDVVEVDVFGREGVCGTTVKISTHFRKPKKDEHPAPVAVGSPEQINNTDYYRLPCGRYLEDYIEYKQYSFAFGSCMKYEWRKGKKGGESEEKDANKTGHYIRFIASARGYDEEKVRILLDNALEGARKWDGKIETPTVGSKYWKGGVSDAFI